MSQDSSKDQTRDILERAIPKIAAQIEEIVEGRDRKSITHKCVSCGNTSKIELPVADADMLVKALGAASSALQRIQAKDDPTSARATKILRDRSELSDAELAEYIARLKIEIESEVGSNS